VVHAVIALALLAQARDDRPQSPTAMHLRIELDDLDLEIRRQHISVEAARAHLDSVRRASQRGVVSREEMEQAKADLRNQEAREAEVIAFRALKTFEHDVVSGEAKPDRDKGFDLLADLLKKQEAMARVDLDFRAYMLQNNETLLQRRAIGRMERDSTELDYDAARHNVALCRARLAEVAYERARLAAPGPGPDELQKLKLAYFRARLDYYQAGVALAKLRLDMARERFRLNRADKDEVASYQQWYEEADRLLAVERKRLDTPDAPAPSILSRTV
jgi:outer membrane protein TolC